MEFNRCFGCMRELDAPGAVCPHCGYDNANDPSRQPSHVLSCGTVLDGQYVVGRSLGQGGFGITYLGYDLKLEMPVCIKEYYPEGAAMRSATQSSMVYWGSSENAQSLRDSRKSFVKEAQKAVKLRNLSHVVSVWSVFYENETAYIVMDYIEGETLKDKLLRTQKPLGEKECVELLTPVMQDLEKAHERGIIHRDVKPENIMLDKKGEPVLLDMGAAKDLAKSGQDGSTLSSTLVVSQGFSPLEQYNRNGSIGPWTDIYAVCATVYYCVTGHVLPSATERVGGEEVSFRSCSPALAAVLEKGLAIKTGDRYQTMGELLNALKAAAANPNVKPEPPKPEPPKPEPPKPPRKKTGLVLTLGIAAALLAAGGIYFTTNAKPDAAVTAPTEVPAAAETVISTEDPMPLPESSQDEEEPAREPAQSEKEPVPEPTPEPTPKPTAGDSSENVAVSQAYTEAEALLNAGDKAHAAMAFYALGDEADAHERSIALWREIARPTTIACSFNHSYGVKTNGTVASAGLSSPSEINDWTHIISVAAGTSVTAGLREDGTVFIIGKGDDSWAGVDDWYDIVAITTGDDFCAALKADGTVAVSGSNEFGQHDAAGWRDIVAIKAGKNHIVGLRADGTAVAVGKNDNHQCDVSDWRDIKAVAAGLMYTVGLRKDGTIVKSGIDNYGGKEVLAWHDIVDIVAGITHIAGLKADGTVVAVGSSEDDRCSVSAWRDIVEIAAGDNHTLGLKADGTAVTTVEPKYDLGQTEVTGWKDIRLPDAVGIAAYPGGSLEGIELLEQARAAERGIGVGRDSARAAELYQEALDAGNEEALTPLGMMYFTGRGVDRDYSRAEELFLQAAENGDAAAMCALGELYHNGYLGTEDDDKALSWYRKAADGQSYAGMVELGFMYRNGYGTDKDPDEASAWAERAMKRMEEGIDTEDVLTAFTLGRSYYLGFGPEKDYGKALSYFQKAADAKYPPAMRFVGVMYRSGYGVEKDFSKAAEYYQKAAEAGDTSSMINMGMLYRNGEGVKQDFDKALEWYQKALDAGETGSTMYNIGYLYYSGAGGDPDYATAMEWYLKAAELGNENAAYMIGLMYHLGNGVEKDDEKAMEWYLKAAELGSGSAMYSIGYMYRDGISVDKDYDKAVEWFQKGVENNDSISCYSLGKMYEEGTGVKQDYGKALELYQKGADANYSGAMFALGEMYEKGYGVEKNESIAREWYQKAADLGSSSAKKKLQ